MESIKQDIEYMIDKYLKDKGGDITPLQYLQLENLITQISECLNTIIQQNK